MSKKITIAKALAPEDITPGIYIMVLHEVDEFLVGSCGYAPTPTFKTVDVVTRPDTTGIPARVVSVCLPFVSVIGREDEPFVYDTRKVRLARVDTRFAKRAIGPGKDDKNDPCACKSGKRRFRFRRNPSSE